MQKMMTTQEWCESDGNTKYFYPYEFSLLNVVHHSLNCVNLLNEEKNALLNANAMPHMNEANGNEKNEKKIMMLLVMDINPIMIILVMNMILSMTIVGMNMTPFPMIILVITTMIIRILIIRIITILIIIRTIIIIIMLKKN